MLIQIVVAWTPYCSTNCPDNRTPESYTVRYKAIDGSMEMFKTVESPDPGTELPETQVTLTTGIQSNTAYSISIMTNTYKLHNPEQTVSSDFSSETTGYTGMFI